MARKGDNAAVAFLAVMMVIAPFVAAYYLFKLLRWIWRRWRAYKLRSDPAYRLRVAMRMRSLDILEMDPIAFERHCAAVLEAQGWLCEITQASGDFGVDVIARKPGAQVVIQVKKWRASVDLSAVQQAVAGIAMYRATAAAVVSVSGYRPSAVRLARANRVLLLSYDDLFDFTRRVPSRRR